MIYIDPPYNTGKDFVYSDKFQMSEEELADEMDLRDEDGLQRVGLTKNEKSSARYHSDWLNMMYPRLVLARNLLKDSGVIFISIDDNEQANLKAICDEIFGDVNNAGIFPWQSRQSMQNDTDISINHEYILVYAKKRRIDNRRLKETNLEKWLNKDSFVFQPLELSKEKFENPDNDPRGLWKADPFDAPNVRPNLTYEITNPNTGEVFLPPIGRHWRVEKNTYEKLFNDNRILFGKSGSSKPQLKVFYEEKKLFGSIDNSWFTAEKYGTTTKGSKELKLLFGDFSPFDTPKPSLLLKQLLRLSTRKDDDITVLDFFAGSATTAHAVMQLNAEDGGNRKYILCTLDEQVADKSAAKEAGYETIDQISRERIRRAAKKIQEEHPETVGKQDFGFRAYKLDSSNFKDVSQTPDSFSQESLFDSVSNIKDGRTDLDLLFQIMLTWGMELSLPIAKTQIDGTDIYNVADGALIACFADEISESVLRQIAKEEPLRAVFKDESFANSAAKINLGQIFKEEAPNTKVKVV
ncbi:TPA: site-specific DNA-methyltransferase [Streptococcus suis]|nr:site-specific DNA-methyltransferase [Streptococcus suis]